MGEQRHEVAVAGCRGRSMAVFSIREGLAQLQEPLDVLGDPLDVHDIREADPFVWDGDRQRLSRGSSRRSSRPVGSVGVADHGSAVGAPATEVMWRFAQGLDTDISIDVFSTYVRNNHRCFQAAADEGGRRLCGAEAGDRHGGHPRGVPLDEAELAEHFELGRTPIREALKRLAVERFVLWLPRRPPIVAEMSVQDVKKPLQARATLEDAVSRFTALRITDEQIEGLFALCDDLGEALQAGAYYEAVEIDFALHNAIAQGSDNRYLANAITNLNSGALRLWYQTFEQNADSAAAVAAHRRIVQGLATHDPDAASNAVQQQMASALQRQMQLGTAPSPSRIHLSDVG